MFFLRLGVHQCASGDRPLIESAFRLYASDASFAWKLVDEPPFEVLIMYCPVARPRSGSSIEGAYSEATLALVRSDGQFHPLARPICTAEFRSLLRQIHCAMLGGLRLEGESVIPPVEEPIAADTRQVMLRDWPPASLLRNDRQKIDLAVLLLERKVSMRELAALSGQPISQCSLFVQSLDRAGLVEHYAFEVPTSAQRLRWARPAIAQRKSTQRGFGARIRHLLERLAS